MKIYGIYDLIQNELCLRIGTLNEVVRFLDFTPREIGRAIKTNSTVRNRYKVYYLFEEVQKS